MSMVLFHVDDVYLYNQQFPYNRYPDPAEVLLPGLRVAIDARSVPRFKGVAYQVSGKIRVPFHGLPKDKC